MTEQEWLKCGDPTPMLEFVRGKASDRKLRLFGCACCWRMLPSFSEQRFRKAIEVAESYADGAASEAERLEAEIGIDAVDHITHLATPGVCVIHEDAFRAAATASMFAAACVVDADEPSPAEQVVQSTILRDIIANPFRATKLKPDLVLWNAGLMRKMARMIYDHRAFDRLPILADALEEAGCNNADILTHCRSPGPHVRGCWVVDLILAKQ